MQTQVKEGQQIVIDTWLKELQQENVDGMTVSTLIAFASTMGSEKNNHQCNEPVGFFIVT
jgi:hypothetical protein